jgi:ATP synthase F1 complex assembly factor 2
MERATYATKSFLISLALVQGELSIDQAADASRVEVLSQIKRWGEVEDCQSLFHSHLFLDPNP